MHNDKHCDFYADNTSKNLKPSYAGNAFYEMIISDEKFESPDTPCDPFVKVIIGGEPILQTRPRKNTERFDADESATSGRIERKTAIITIQLWDDNEQEAPAFMFETSGTVDSFLEKPKRCNNPVSDRPKIENCVTVDVIWQDERN